MQKITTFLWYNGQAEEAANFYVSVFGEDSKIISANPMSVIFQLRGQQFYALNGGPQFKFTEAISLFVTCENQEEIDYFWNKFTSGGGQESMCGWCKDKYGLSWQIIPKDLNKWIGAPDPVKAQKAVQVMLQMKKLDIAKLEAAAK